MQENFTVSVNFTLLPADDGQPFHVTKGDPGGATAWGITLPTLTRWLRRQATQADLHALTQVEARLIYERLYWDADNCNSLPGGADLMVFDHGVVGGDRSSTKLLQRVLGVDDDGICGPITLAAAAKRRPMGLIDDLGDAQEAFYRSLLTFPEFGRGWLARVQRRHDAALAILHD